MPWVRRKLRDNIVFAKANGDGSLDVAADGRVEIRYKPDPEAKVYRAAARNLADTGAKDDGPRELESFEAPKTQRKGKGKGTKRERKPAASANIARVGDAPDGAVIVYTDGACTGNPGPAGLGVVILDGGERTELSEYLGIGTNNIAELTAIERALEELHDDARSRPVYLHSDSSYSIGLLTKGWKAKANTELVARLRALAERFEDLHLVKVKGHAGVPENERADELAREAIERSA